jgi:hypothetical protein
MLILFTTNNGNELMTIYQHRRRSLLGQIRTERRMRDATAFLSERYRDEERVKFVRNIIRLQERLVDARRCR